jgi:ubiquinone/menaquinone biosynthesis C-methylase UbiE
MAFVNVYQDRARAEAYSKLEFANTYHLAYRDLPELAAKYATGKKALDFGCGTGRSTRFLKTLGFEAIGLDIADDMLRQARQTDPQGDYRRVPDGDLSRLGGAFDLVLSAFTFDNIPSERKLPLFRHLRRLLESKGVLLNLVSSPEIYLHEWASFTTRDFPENRRARDGDIVRIVTTDIADRRPCEDVLCGDDSYRELYRQAGFEVLEMRRPLATGAEPYSWVSETTIAPWVIWALRPRVL